MSFKNWLDGVLSSIAPGIQLRRDRARVESEKARMHLDANKQIRDLIGVRVDRLKRSWDGAEDTTQRSRRWLASGLSPDHGLDEDLAKLQERCADLYRNSGIAHSAIEGRVANEVGIGIMPQPSISPEVMGLDGSRLANSQIEKSIRRWSKNGVDEKRKLSLPAFQRTVARSYATFGEAFVLVSSSQVRSGITTYLQLISPERIETPPSHEADPSVRLGIQYQGDLPVGYWVRTTHPGDENAEFDFEFIPRWNEDGDPQLLHVFEPLFPEQSRGIPWLAAAMDRIRDLDDWFEAELLNKQVEACFGLIIQKRADLAGDVGNYAENVADEVLPDGTRVADWQPGDVQYLNEGEEAKVVDPNRPGSNFVPFVDKSLRTIAAALQIPYEVLAKDFHDQTFSSGRLAMLDGQIGFDMRQQVLVDQLLIPIYPVILHESIFDGSVPAINVDDYIVDRMPYQDHRWQGQGKDHIDPEKQTKANALGLQSGQMTLADINHQSGKHWEDQQDQIEAEEKRIAEREARVAKHRIDAFEALGISPPEVQEEEENNEPEEREPANADD